MYCKGMQVSQVFFFLTSVIASYNNFKETVGPLSFPSKSLARYKLAAGIMGGISHSSITIYAKLILNQFEKSPTASLVQISYINN